MPRRTWKAPSAETLAQHLETYPCPTTCKIRKRMEELFGVSTEDIDNEIRTNGAEVPLAKQMVNGPKMRKLIAKFISIFGDALSNGIPDEYPTTKAEFEKDRGAATGYVLGAISDFCFNLEYIRRVKDTKWAYCSKNGDHRVYYPYLGVCPHCIRNASRPAEAMLGAKKDTDDESKESSARYFGNKIESHHVGRIGERVIVYILDLLTKSKYPDAKTLMVTDDQHDVDTAFFFDGVGVLAQIKASPLILLPLVSKLHAPILSGTDPSTGLPTQAKDHSLTDFASAEQDLALYFSIDNTSIPIGPRNNENWPYEPIISGFDKQQVLKIVENWIKIYLAFAIPKKQRREDDIKLAYLTAGWGAPIDDNKTKSGLARSDNMMKGTYASIKYGAYYVQECSRRTLRSALVANIDPAHQYEDYLEKLENIRWAHDSDFIKTPGKDELTISEGKLSYLFDSVFTFNRQIMNDDKLSSAWNLTDFSINLQNKTLDVFLEKWAEAEL